MTTSRICRNCRNYKPISMEDSGLQSGWTYAIGECQEIRSCHSGKSTQPEWCSACEYYRVPFRQRRAS